MVAVLGAPVILPYRLYQRDIRNATVHAHRISSITPAALGRAMQKGEVHPALTSGTGTSRLHSTYLTDVSSPIIHHEGPPGWPKFTSTSRP